MWERFSGAGRVAWSLLGVGAVLAVLFWISWQFRVIFPPLVLAGAIVFLLNPIVTGLHRRGIPRAAGTGLSYLAFVALIVAFGFLVAPLVGTQAEELAEQWPELRADIEQWLDDLAERSEEDDWMIQVPSVDELRDQFGGGNDSAENREFDRVVEDAAAALEDSGEPVLAADLDRVAADARAQFPGEGGIVEQLRTVREVGTRIFEVGLIFVLAPIIAFYLLVDLPHIGQVSRDLIPEPVKGQVLHVAHRLNAAIGGFFRGQLAVAVIVGIMVSAGLAVLDLPFWLIVGMIAGVFNMVPLIGPWVGAVPGVVIALTTRDFGTALWVVAIMTGAQQIDNHFISPMVMQRAVRLHPAVVMLALLAGGTLGGFFGLLLAVPVTAALKVVVGHLWAVYVLQRPLEEIIASGGVSAPGAAEDTVLEPVEDYVHNTLGTDGGDADEDGPADADHANDADDTGPVADDPRPGRDTSTSVTLDD